MTRMMTMARKPSKPQEIELLVPTRKDSRVKMMRSIANTGFLNCWEGSIRSGKTMTALLSWAYYITTSEATVFLMTGRTVGSIERNAILSEYGLLNIMGLGSDAYRTVGESKAIVFKVKGKDGNLIDKKVYVLGGNDAKSSKALRGLTIHGCFIDEANTVPEDYLAETLNRSALSPDRKNFWTLNPDNPHHWIYKDYLDHYDSMTKAEKKKLGGYYWWHFTPIDNPAMTEQMLASLDAMYPKGSYLHRRFVLGERCIAEGLVYPEITDMYFRDFSKEEIEKTDIRYCAIDVGFNHPTVMHFGGIFNRNSADWRIVDEIFDEKSGKTTYDYYVAFLDKCRSLGVDPNRITIAIDPSALSLRTEFINRGLNVVKAKNEVLAGIEYFRRIVTTGHLLFSDKCKGLRSNLGEYAWNVKKGETTGQDEVLKVNDDACDSARYFAMTFIRPFVR